MRRVLYWFGVVVGVLMLAAGVTIGALGYAATAGPAGAVRGYFAALARSDAPTALAYGDVPAGPRALLTADVLREQQRIAPLRALTIVATRRDGDTALVDVRYLLAFPGSPVTVSDRVAVHKAGAEWRLDRVAVAVQLRAGAARQRQSVLGTELPATSTLLFPGAFPVSLDTPYLQLDPYEDYAGFGTHRLADVQLEVSADGRSAVTRAVLAAVRRCVTGPPDPACPLPDERYVPGSIHGVLRGGPRSAEVQLDPDNPLGMLHFVGRITVDGTYRRLTFHNVAVTGHGSVDLELHAEAYAVAPVRLRWTAS